MHAIKFLVSSQKHCDVINSIRLGWATHVDIPGSPVKYENLYPYVIVYKHAAVNKMLHMPAEEP